MPIILLSSLPLREKSVKINLNKAALYKGPFVQYMYASCMYVCMNVCILWVTWALWALAITYSQAHRMALCL